MDIDSESSSDSDYLVLSDGEECESECHSWAHDQDKNLCNSIALADNVPRFTGKPPNRVDVTWTYTNIVEF